MPENPIAPAALEEEEKESYMDYNWDQPGSPPGTLRIDEDAQPTTLYLIDYSEHEIMETDLATPEDCIPYLDKVSVSWVDVRGLGSEKVLHSLGKVFTLHPLVLEDVVNVPQRPKIEPYIDQLVLITRMILPDKEGFRTEQVSFILGQYYLLTVQEDIGDCFDVVRRRLQANVGVIRRQQADYLAYVLLDALIDGFFPVLEQYGEQIQQLEDEVLQNPSREIVQQVYQLKRNLLTLRRAIWPLRDAINTLIRDEHPLISAEVRVYLRDCYDHTIQVLDMVETYRELAASLMDVYLSAVSNRMNEVMKTLTIISTIFIPLTFVVGVYGMNFDNSPLNMPELHWYWGYPTVWGFMIILAVGLVYYFWKRGWFENWAQPPKDE